MKIVYLHQYFATPDQAGGTRSYEMARRWVERGHEVHVVTARSSSDRRGWTAKVVDGIHVHSVDVPYSNHMPYARRLVSFALFALLTGFKARSLRGDVVFATSTPLTVFLPARYATLLRPTPIVFEVRDLWPEVPIAMGALRSRPARWLAYALQRWAYRASRHVVALSSDMAEGVRRAGVEPERITVAENACDLDLFDVPAEQGHAYRRSHDWLGVHDLVVYCGTMGRANGLSYMVDVAAEFRRRGRSTRFAIYGEGAERDLVQQRARDAGVLGTTFFLEAPVSKSELPTILSAASVASSFVVPVEEMQWNSANKFFDALAAGRPILINHEGWQARLLREHRCGLVVPPDDPAAAADVLESFLDLSDRERAAYGQRARALGRASFARDDIAQRVLEVLERA